MVYYVYDVLMYAFCTLNTAIVAARTIKVCYVIIGQSRYERVSRV